MKTILTTSKSLSAPPILTSIMEPVSELKHEPDIKYYPQPIGIPYIKHNDGFCKIPFNAIINGLNNKYSCLNKIGGGAFSNVYKVKNINSDKDYALKIIRDTSKYKNYAIKETDILLKINNRNNNIIEFIEVFNYGTTLCFIFELYNHNLYNILKANNMKPFDINSLYIISISLLDGLLFLQNNHIMHCDLKPENIVTDGTNYKIIDFGSSIYSYEITNYTYIQSRYYRSPKCVLSSGKLDCDIDHWSLGCIMFELATGYPLFYAKNEYWLLYSQLCVIDIPSQYIMTATDLRDNMYNFKYNTWNFTKAIKKKTIKDLLNKKNEIYINYSNTEQLWITNETDGLLFLINECIHQHFNINGSNLYKIISTFKPYINN